MDLRSKNKINRYQATVDALVQDYNENHGPDGRFTSGSGSYTKGNANVSGPIKTFTITNSFGQKERREAKIVKSLKDIPVGMGKVGTVGDYDIWADTSAKKLEFAKQIFALKK